MDLSTSWIGRRVNKDGVITYKKVFVCDREVKRAELKITACGVFTAYINGEKVSSPLAPGYSSYNARLEVQTYPVKNLKVGENSFEISVAPGWFKWYKWLPELVKYKNYRAVTACLNIDYKDGTAFSVTTDQTFTAFKGKTVWGSIYDGECYNANNKDKKLGKVTPISVNLPLIESQAVKIKEQEIISPKEIITTPKGETVIDFGQNLTGFVRFSVNAKKGDKIVYTHGEVLDKDGNFYNQNYRSAKSIIDYTCLDGEQTYSPEFSFMGFRYICLNEYPKNIDLSSFKAVVLHSDIKRTGYIYSSSEKLNQLFSNIIWGQKDNFLDVPTDCPQRDERLGWTGDAQVFCKAANYNFDCKKFFSRYLDLIAEEQKIWGVTPIIAPNSRGYARCSAGWGDVATVIPATLYDFYGDKKLLKKHFPIMKFHVDYVTDTTRKKYLWIGGLHYGDWLALDGKELVGSSNKTLIASCYYAYSVSLLIKAGKVLGEDISYYEDLYENIISTINKTYTDPQTQTECALLLAFDIAYDKKAVAEKLVSLIKSCGLSLQTGFIGTPILLHALSQNGYPDIAYELLLRESYPSWLYSVNCGATTIWEHWDSRNEKGEFWDTSMNSFNHYAYGSVADWIYGVAGGINPKDAGFKSIILSPHPTDKLDFLECSYNCSYGKIVSKWYHEDGKIKYHFETPVSATIIIDGKTLSVDKGVYDF
jgi:alpha-L-rhamnosidase